MADPFFDEDAIIGLLSLPATHSYVDGLQAGAVQTLLDLFDRKVTRDEFIAGTASCLSLYAQGAKIWMLHNIKDAFDAGGLDASKFDTADKAMCDLLRKQAVTVTEIVKRLQLCSTSQDAVH